MKKYILPFMGIAAGIGFTGFVAYATVHTTPLAPIAEIIEGEQEQMLAGVAGRDAAITPVAAIMSPEQQTSAATEAAGLQSGIVVPSPTVISPPEIQTQPDEPVNNSRYENEDDEDKDEDD